MELTKEYFKERWVTIVVILLLGWISVVSVSEFIEVSKEVTANEFEQVDKDAAAWAKMMRNDPLTVLMNVVSALGNWYSFLSIFLILGFIMYKQRGKLQAPLIAIAIILGASAVMYILKEAFDRERPTLDTLVDAKLPSFPSGHSMLSVVFYGFVIFYIWKVAKHHVFKVTMTFLLLILIGLICWSRIYLGAHFASDVIAGILAGVGWLAIALMVYLVIKFTRKKEEEINEAHHASTGS